MKTEIQEVQSVNLNKKKKKYGVIWEFKTKWLLYLMVVPALIYLIIFRYLPMIGLVIAFQDFRPIPGITGSEFVGLDNFRFFFRGTQWMQVTFNTFYLNSLFILTGTIASIFIAVIVSEIGKNAFSRITQSIMILPHFITWIVVALFALAFIGSNGLINDFLKSIGRDPISFYNTPGVWPSLFVIVRIWKSAGFGAVIYMASIANIDTDIYEAATIDGASRLARIFRIVLPLLKNTIILLTLLSVGSIFYGDFVMIYAFVGDTAVLFPTTDVIDTYVFRSLRTSGAMGRSAAVGLYQSFIGFILVIATNYFVKKVNPESAIF